MDITTATPAEIDTVLAEIWERQENARFRAYALGQHIDSYAEGLAAWQAGDFRYSSYTQSYLDRLIAQREEQVAIYEACQVEAQPYEDEFEARGGWTRAWKVLNSNGHIHRTMHCHTCFPSTRFGWLPQVSGLDEAEIVDLAGEGACTVCYPSAPAVGPNRLYTPTEQAERDAKAAEKAAKAEAKAAKSLSLDGSTVEVRWDYQTTSWKTGEPVTKRGYKDLKTYRAAELWVVECLSRSGVVDNEIAPADVVNEVIAMMATKRGVPTAEITDVLYPKAEKKRQARVW